MLLTIQPQWALLSGILVLVVTSVLFWPSSGLVARWRKSRWNTKRVLIEDALKFIFDCEYKNRPCHLSSVAGNMHISTDHVTRVLEHLQKMGLVYAQPDTDQFHLTDAGRSYALQVIRVHRIWERYLADETSVRIADWHGAADQMEHQLTPAQADQLAARIGNPVFDPHGDPIPTSKGAIPEQTGRTLSSLKEGDVARIVHVEDEPAAIYEQLLALDLYPGVQVYVMDVTDDKIVFAANGEECVLTPFFASNLTVELASDQPPVHEKMPVLASLREGEQAEIVAISPKCRGQERRRLMDLGFIPGTIVEPLLRSASGDPIAYRVMGTTIAIRESQAQNIFIRPVQNAKAS